MAEAHTPAPEPSLAGRSGAWSGAAPIRAPGSPLDPGGVRRRRPLFWLALAFCAGIVLDDFLQPQLPAVGGLLVSAALAVLAGLVLRPRRGRGYLLFAVALFAGLAGGVFRHALSSRLPPADEITRRTPAAPSLAWLEGTVIEVRRASESHPAERWTLELSALGAAPGALTPACGRVPLVRFPDPKGAPGLHVAEGDRLKVLARLQAPRAATLPEGFDPAAYLARQGIRRVGEPLPGRVAILGTVAWWRADLWLRRWGGALAERNIERLGARRAGLLNALLLGRREGLARSDREAFARAGTAHLLAISGLHVHALAALLWWLLMWGSFSFDRPHYLWWLMGHSGLSRRKSGVAVLLFAFAYAALSGLRASTVRAALMIALYIGALLFRRIPDPLTTLGAAGLLILFVSPDDLFTAGFQLSFLAVFVLVTLYPTLEAAWRKWRAGPPQAWVLDAGEKRKWRWRAVLRRALFISFAAWIGTAPAVAWHMGYLNVWSVAANLVAVPLAILGMIGGALSMLFGGWGADIFCAPLTVLLGFHRWFGAWAGGVVLDVPAPPLLLCAAYAALLGWAWAGRGIAYGPAPFGAVLRGPGDVRWTFHSDAEANTPPKSGSEALCVRVRWAGQAVLFVHARSGASVRRLLSGGGKDLAADVIRLIPGPQGRWPAGTARLIERSGARLIVAGQGRNYPGEGGGLNLAALAMRRGLRLLSPSREGSLRMGERGSGRLEAFRRGRWETLPY